jgi:hyperosmotically inducible periplasmic protein
VEGKGEDMNTNTNIVKTGLFALLVVGSAVLILGAFRAHAAASAPFTMDRSDVLVGLPSDLSALAAGPLEPENAAASQTDQETLSSEVRHRLATLPWVGVFDNLEYAVDGNEVTLSGQVLQPYTKSDAEAAVKRITGVTRVANDITVLPASLFDQQIRRAEFHAIFSDASLGRYAMGALPAIRIIVQNGHVTLEGFVVNEADRRIAYARASGVPNVFSVTNNLRSS